VTRQISPSEASVLERALRVGALTQIAPELFAAIPFLHVTANCKCGCATIWFGPKGDASNGRMLADALATSAGQDIQVMVWAIEEAIVGLELVGPGPIALPDASSVRSYSGA
jgi:hypothetical protein